MQMDQGFKQFQYNVNLRSLILVKLRRLVHNFYLFALVIEKVSVKKRSKNKNTVFLKLIKKASSMLFTRKFSTKPVFE